MIQSSKLIFLILFLAAFLRFYKLGQVPASLYWDEVSIGYNAYSILKTGKDEYGEFLPLRFKAFGEYKLPGLIYLTIPSIKLFGLNEFAVRFPSALLGTLTVLLTYFLTKELFRKTNYLAIIAALSLAISPWHLQFSRGAFEANLGLFFFYLGLFLLLKNFFVLSSLVLTLALYSYYNFWLTVPLLLLYFFFRSSKKKILLSLLLIFIFSLPLIHSVFLKRQQERFSQVSIVSDKTILRESQELKARDRGWLGRIFYHRFFVWGREAFKNYTLHFSPDFLFFKGDGQPRHTPYRTGLLFPVLVPFVILGLVALLGKERIIFFLLLIAPLGASFSLPAPHALRSEMMVVPWQIITGFGLMIFFKFMKKQSFFLKILVLGSLLMIFIFSFVSYLDNYYTHGYLNQALDWGDGYKQMLAFIKENQEGFDKIYVTGSRWQPYIYTLFYLKYDPLAYQKEGSDHGHFGKFYFDATGWDKAGERFYKTKVDLKKFLESNNNLMVMAANETLDLPVVKKIYSVNQEGVFLIYSAPRQ